MQYWTQQEVFDIGKTYLINKKLKPTKKFINYLVAFQDDDLNAGLINRPISYTAQRKKLIDIMRNKFTSFGMRQIISGLDIDIQNYFELIFVMHFITHEIVLTDNVEYAAYEMAPGVKTTRKIPHAEFKIVDKNVLKTVGVVEPSTVGRNTNGYKAHIILEDRIVYAALEDGTKYRISRRLRTDLGPHLFIKLILSYPRTYITRIDLKDLISKSDITELVRSCGFNEPLKKIFFPDTTEQIVHFQPDVDLNDIQLKLLKEHRWE